MGFISEIINKGLKCIFDFISIIYNCDVNFVLFPYAVCNLSSLQSLLYILVITGLS